MRTFNGFFSYAHIDAKAWPSLIEALTSKLETLVTVKLINAKLSIFYDEIRLHTGDRWDPTIDKALRESDILIVLFTPSWLESDYCRKEYSVFEDVERSYGGGGYVVPIRARPIGEQEQHLTSDQRLVYESLKDRQYFPMLVSDFLLLDENARQKELEEVSDDIVGILERRRDLAESTSSGGRPLSPRRTATEWRYPRSIQDFEKVDFISNEEVMIDQARAGQPRGVYAQIDFAERLSVEGNHGNSIVFSVRQAYLTVGNEGPGKLSQANDLRDLDGRQNAFFVRMLDAPNAISICIDPVPGKTGLAELALPPASGENRLSRVATATADVEAGKVKAELRVTLDAKGLNLPEAKVSQAKRSQITAIILEAARRRHQVTEKGEIHRSISVRERE